MYILFCLVRSARVNNYKSVFLLLKYFQIFSNSTQDIFWNTPDPERFYWVKHQAWLHDVLTLDTHKIELEQNSMLNAVQRMENIARWCQDVYFIFEWAQQVLILTRKLKLVSLSHLTIFFFNYTDKPTFFKKSVRCTNF